MPGNNFGSLYKLTSFGESHGMAIGGIIDGCPSGLVLDFDFIQKELNRRKPGQSNITTSRPEDDRIEFLSGVYNGITLGTPIGFVVWNKASKSADYDNLKDVFRPSHADFTYQKKYGIRDHRGGGRSSARETIARVVAGAIAKQFLLTQNILIAAYVKQIGKIATTKKFTVDQIIKAETNIVNCPDQDCANKMVLSIEETKKEGDSLGGIIQCCIENLPIGLGEPVFDKFHSQMGKAILSINAVKGIEFGAGFNASMMRGSEHNDAFTVKNGEITTMTNNAGGILGGLTNGQGVYFNIAFKPTASILSKQKTVDKNNKEVSLKIDGRHDPCVLPRAVPIVEAMAAMVTLDFYLLKKAYQ